MTTTEQNPFANQHLFARQRQEGYHVISQKEYLADSPEPFGAFLWVYKIVYVYLDGSWRFADGRYEYDIRQSAYRRCLNLNKQLATQRHKDAFAARTGMDPDKTHI